MTGALELGGERRPSLGGGAWEAISRLRTDIASGRHWYLALLEAASRWDLEGEVCRERQYRYLIGGEAFDWLVLAERLLGEVGGSVPAQEAEAFLFSGQPPLELKEEELRRLMGYAKYCAHLNYLYGVTVEEALLLAVEGEVRKERRCRAAKEDLGLEEEVYQRTYGRPYSWLLAEFCRQQGCASSDSLTLSSLKEFTYWLFKYRVRNSHKARLASDTKKGLDELRRQRELARLHPPARAETNGSHQG